MADKFNPKGIIKLLGKEVETLKLENYKLRVQNERMSNQLKRIIKCVLD